MCQNGVEVDQSQCPHCKYKPPEDWFHQLIRLGSGGLGVLGAICWVAATGNWLRLFSKSVASGRSSQVATYLALGVICYAVASGVYWVFSTSQESQIVPFQN